MGSRKRRRGCSLERDVKSPWFGVNFDSGNFHGEDVYGELAQIAPYSINVQIKVVISPAGRKREASDFKRLAKIMRDAGYRGTSFWSTRKRMKTHGRRVRKL